MRKIRAGINEIIIIRLINAVHTDRSILVWSLVRPKPLDSCQICKRTRAIVRTTKLRNRSLNHIECVSRGLNFHISISNEKLLLDIYIYMYYIFILLWLRCFKFSRGRKKILLLFRFDFFISFGNEW